MESFVDLFEKEITSSLSFPPPSDSDVFDLDAFFENRQVTIQSDFGKKSCEECHSAAIDPRLVSNLKDPQSADSAEFSAIFSRVWRKVPQTIMSDIISLPDQHRCYYPSCLKLFPAHEDVRNIRFHIRKDHEPLMNPRKERVWLCGVPTCSHKCASVGDVERHLQSLAHQRPSQMQSLCEKFTRSDALKRHLGHCKG